ncbi:PrsW family glutamic-type intramembrane protease [Tenggerimyces flavus]|uniref:PrsW family glutamic-type intramembrane protease n=1 Tax=Tenggerimyces flavus TaxID=1708749 RepID=A0ABV7Y917_9ACTN|nr:PrsW family glutamic-type intramembrane protease [Tenggerimyces flavus]MBM7783589.1 RsiW-degrading membrane proteinase PrsW (M82 family) [Tenggerimyces flavus]
MTATPPPGVAPGPAPWTYHQPWAAQQRKRVLLPILGLVVMAILILVIIGLAVIGTGPVPVLLATFFAMLPVLPVVGAFLWLDRWEPEPGRMLLTAFLWGAGVATVSSLIVSLVASVAWSAVVGPEASEVFGTVVTAPVVEEFFKGLLLVLLLFVKRREFDGVVDGIVYAGLIGIGFAFTENILYLGNAFAAGGLEGGLQLFILRCVVSPFAHPLFTSLTGLAVGVASRSSSTAAKILLPILGYLGAVLLHGLWNGSATFAGGPGFIAVYVAIMVPIFVIMIIVVGLQRRRERMTVGRHLPEFVNAGWVAPDEVPLLSTLAGRRGWRAAVKRQSGPVAAQALKAYQRAVTELAFLRDRMARGAVGADAGPWHDEVVSSLLAARQQVLQYPKAFVAAWNQPPPAGWQQPPAVLPPGAPGAQAMPQPPGQPGYYQPTQQSGPGYYQSPPAR